MNKRGDITVDSTDIMTASKYYFKNFISISFKKCDEMEKFLKR